MSKENVKIDVRKKLKEAEKMISLVYFEVEQTIKLVNLLETKEDKDLINLKLSDLIEVIETSIQSKKVKHLEGE